MVDVIVKLAAIAVLLRADTKFALAWAIAVGKASVSHRCDGTDQIGIGHGGKDRGEVPMRKLRFLRSRLECMVRRFGWRLLMT